VSSGPAIGVIPQTPPPIPPRTHTGPLNAVGATRFVAFGDSITYGTLSSFDGVALFDIPTHSYPVRLDLGLNHYHQPQQFTVINRGVPAEAVAEGGVQRIQSVLTNDRPQALLLLEGINDLNGGRSIGATVAALDTVLDYARVYNTTVLIATMFQTYVSEAPDGRIRTNAADQVPAFNAAIRQMAAGRQNVFLVDLEPVFHGRRHLVGGDGLHPSEAGYEVMASTFLAVIETAFPVRGSFQ
jgi:lysophospholipase L1-like esterase